MKHKKKKKRESFETSAMVKQEAGKASLEEMASGEEDEAFERDMIGKGGKEERNWVALKKENEELQEKVLRKLAELENYKKRAAKEKSEASIMAKMDWARELLPVIDNFERALAFSGENQDRSFREGMELIQRQLLDVLKKMGVTEIEALGEKFDPELHEAIETKKTDQWEKGIILEVKRKGYLLEGRLLRPSYVCVSVPMNDLKKEERP